MHIILNYRRESPTFSFMFSTIPYIQFFRPNQIIINDYLFFLLTRNTVITAFFSSSRKNICSIILNYRRESPTFSFMFSTIPYIQFYVFNNNKPCVKSVDTDFFSYSLHFVQMMFKFSPAKYQIRVGK